MSHIRWQCRRGMLELDVIFDRFLNQHYEKLSDEKKKLFERLLGHDDPVLYDWLITGVVCPDVTLQSIIDEVLMLHMRSRERV